MTKCPSCKCQSAPTRQRPRRSRLSLGASTLGCLALSLASACGGGTARSGTTHSQAQGSGAEVSAEKAAPSGHADDCRDRVPVYTRAQSRGYQISDGTGALQEVPDAAALRTQLVAHRRHRPRADRVVVLTKNADGTQLDEMRWAATEAGFGHVVACAEESCAEARLEGCPPPQAGSDQGSGELEAGSGQGEGAPAVSASASAGSESGPPPTPHVSTDTLDVTGNLSVEAVQEVVDEHVDEISSCYQHGLAHDRQLAGNVSVTFLVTTDGSVESSIINFSDLDNRGVQDCIAQAVRSWTFPAPQGGMVGVRVPYELSTSN